METDDYCYVDDVSTNRGQTNCECVVKKELSWRCFTIDENQYYLLDSLDSEYEIEN